MAARLVAHAAARLAPRADHADHVTRKTKAALPESNAAFVIGRSADQVDQ